MILLLRTLSTSIPWTIGLTTWTIISCGCTTVGCGMKSSKDQGKIMFQPSEYRFHNTHNTMLESNFLMNTRKKMVSFWLCKTRTRWKWPSKTTRPYLGYTLPSLAFPSWSTCLNWCRDWEGCARNALALVQDLGSVVMEPAWSYLSVDFLVSELWHIMYPNLEN